jgi:hypothetical protein
MDFTEWVRRLPEVGDDAIAKTKRLDQLREEAHNLEMEIWAILNANWKASEIVKARGF